MPCDRAESDLWTSRRAAHLARHLGRRSRRTRGIPRLARVALKLVREGVLGRVNPARGLAASLTWRVWPSGAWCEGILGRVNGQRSDERGHRLPRAVAGDPAAVAHAAEEVRRAAHGALDGDEPDELFDERQGAAHAEKHGVVDTE